MNHLFKPHKQALLFTCLWISILFLALPAQSIAQIFGHGQHTSDPFYEESAFQVLDYRSIGPYRGGRALAVDGVDDQPLTFYTGFTGGGVFKTIDGGKTWINISDGYFKTGSVGALAVADSDPNVIYVGMGEACIRGNMSAGDGIYKSTDAGETWTHIGLGKTRIIGEIVVHPDNPDIVWVAAMGHTFGMKGNKERGVYKTTDGGKTWEKVLYRDANTGAVHIEVDPNNPRILYATLWEAYRNPWKMSSGGNESGGYGSGLYKSTDSGETWTNISHRPGLPKGILGKIEVAISPANSNRIWAMIEAENGGLFRSDDGGKTWELVNNDRSLRQRAWYYTHITADPVNENTVYVLNVNLHKSTDGGKTFTQIETPHGDHHDLWIDPDNPNRMIVADDGGGQVSYNGGESWSSYFKYATAQFYHVITDDRFPYRVYGAQQDNSTVVIKNRSGDRSITIREWHSVGGGESGYIAPDPENPKITFAGSYGGLLTKHNSNTGELDVVNVWPNNPMGHGAVDLKYRFQWTYPIYISPHNPDVLYATSQHVHRSLNEGMSWERISPDLTRDEESKQQKSGGPITYDDTSIEYYNTVFSFAESPVKQGVLWAGADDGLVHVSRNNGESWTNVTPPDLRDPENRARINIIDPSPHDAGTVYIAATRYKQSNFEPLLYKSEDYGESWTKITNGIPSKEFTRVIRADPAREGLLYAGTEAGVYVSFNDGEKWQPLQLDLPSVPITDMTIQRRDKDLVIATQGRSFYILDDLAVLHQLSDEAVESEAYLFKPEDTYLIGRRGSHEPGTTVGQNPHRGVIVYYHLNGVSEDSEVQLQFLKDEDIIRTFSNQFTAEGEPVEESEKYYEKENPDNSTVLTDKYGLNRFVWNMRYPGATDLEGVQILWGGSTRGPEAVPGTYTVRLLVDDEPVMEQEFAIKKDPRETATQQDLEAQFDLHQKIIAKLDTTHKAINHLREARSNLTEMLAEFPEDKQLQEKFAQVKKALDAIEMNLVQAKAESFQDVLNYPIKLNNKLAALASTVATGKGRPTKQQYAVYNDLAQKVDVQLRRLEKVLSGEYMDNLPEQVTEPVLIQN
ncbi:MAG TPA: glycosyl hydrolase [Balneolaceae bacterium]